MKSRNIAVLVLLLLLPPGARVFAGLTLVGHLDNKHGTSNGVSYSACWGYVGPDGREYALLTTVTGTAIIEITDTADIHEIVHIGGPTSLWREVRTYRDRAYVVTEGGGGTQIIDLSLLPDTATLIKTFTYTSGPRNTARVHTIEIFDGYMYLNGCANWGTNPERGAVIFSLGDPDNPAFAGEYSPDYFHDTYVRNDTLFGAAVYAAGGIYIADVSNKGAPVTIGKISYAGSGTHNVWQSADGRYVLSTDEIGSTQKTLKIWNLDSLPSVPSLPAATYTVSPTDIVHNVFVRGDYAYVAWYTAGIAVVDISDPASPVTAGAYDTSVEPPGSYEGVWGVYPYFWSGKVIAGDMQNGLYVFLFDSLSARTPVSLLEPADDTILDDTASVLFRWTAAADQGRDPHTYRLVVEGVSYDTTVNTGTDTSFLFSSVALTGSGYFSWHVLTVDDVNAVSSPDSFTIIKPTAEVVAPAGGESFRMGSVQEISWSASTDSVEISWSPDGGLNWVTLAAVPSLPPVYAWEVPDTPTFSGLMRVRGVSDPSVVGLSGGVFTVYAAPVPVSQGWNLLSAPSDVLDNSVATNFPHAASGLFTYDGGYAVSDTVPGGAGFWLKHPVSQVEYSVGFRITEDTIPVSGKWNMIGSLTDPVAVAAVGTLPPSLVLTDFYGYSPDSGYFAVDTLRPGSGYWVKSSGPGEVLLSSVMPPSASKRPGLLPEGAGGLVFSSGGWTRTVFFTAAARGRDDDPGDATAFMLPPPPPGGMDVRYEDGSFFHTVGARTPARLIVTGTDGPVHVSPVPAGPAGTGWSLTEVVAGERGRAYDLSAGAVLPGGGTGNSIVLLLEQGGASIAPASYRLRQNHPNPFNPSTVITYDLPRQGAVELAVFNVLGERVVTLVDEVQQAGNRAVEFRAEGLPSGVYFYRLKAGGFTQVKKMLLAR